MSDPATTTTTKNTALAPLPEQMGGPLEDSLSHLVENSLVEAGAGKDQLARTSIIQ